MVNIAVIPARGDSKRIPRKNIKRFHGKPIKCASHEISMQDKDNNLCCLFYSTNGSISNERFNK